MIVNGVEKLICHFKPRKNYVVHYRNLRQYLEMGMRITAVHRGISFNQSTWINQVSKRLNLTDEQKYELYNKLMKIDNHVMEILNKQYCRKRMISIFYLIKKLLEEMGCEKYKLVYLKISPQTLENYEKWWDSYKSLNNTSVKKTNK